VKFKVKRTSLWDGEQPCNNATEEKYTRFEVRTLNSFEEFDKRFGSNEDKWLSKGINHCINERGYVQREIPDVSIGWFIEINSLEELMKFYKENGELIIRGCWDNPNINIIEIYDDYRE